MSRLNYNKHINQNGMKQLITIIAAFLIILAEANSQNLQTQKQQNMENKDQYTFRLSETVTRQKVTFKNRYGITLTGDLYLPKKNDGNKPLAALAISGPFGAVKEQSSGLYAN